MFIASKRWAFIPVPAMSIAVPMDALRAASKTVRRGPRQNEE